MTAAPMLIAIDATEIAAMREELRALRMEIRNVHLTTGGDNEDPDA